MMLNESGDIVINGHCIPPQKGRPVGQINRFSERIISLFRMMVGLLFMCHGASSLFGVLGGAGGKGSTLPIGTWPGWWAALIEFVTGLLVLFGLGTRGAAFLASGTMAYAYFTVHQEHALFPIQNGGEPAVLFCWAFFLILFLGPGPWSLDRLIRGNRTPIPQVAELDATT
jgi:putative oxidoreductase